MRVFLGEIAPVVRDERIIAIERERNKISVLHTTLAEPDNVIGVKASCLRHRQ
jgi:hypothetical protein